MIFNSRLLVFSSLYFLYAAFSLLVYLIKIWKPLDLLRHDSGPSAFTIRQRLQSYIFGYFRRTLLGKNKWHGKAGTCGIGKYRCVCWLLTGWSFIVLVNVTETQLVAAPPKGVREQGHGEQVHVRVRSLRLVRTGTVKIPYGTICKEAWTIVWMRKTFWFVWKGVTRNQFLFVRNHLLQLQFDI